MKYEKFKGKISEALQDYSGKKYKVEIIRVQKTNGLSCDGIQAVAVDAVHSVNPVIRLDGFYEAYNKGAMDMDECARAIYRELKKNEIPQNMAGIMEDLADWDLVRDNVYPILLSTAENKELLEELVSVPMLDLSVVYIIRKEMMEGRCGSVKISKKMLECYGISSKKLHKQAMENLEKDGYEFLNIEHLLQNLMQVKETGMEDENTRLPEMYILTNSKSYGAAGILNRKIIREFAKGQDYFILPSSLHETIFVPASDEGDKVLFDAMVKNVNDAEVSVEERLSDHSYYYDAKADEIRICA